MHFALNKVHKGYKDNVKLFSINVDRTPTQIIR